MLEVERSKLLQQVSVILQQCQMIVSRLSSSSSAPVHVVCQCQPSAPILDHNDNYWWDGYTAQLTKFSSEFYSLLSPTYDDLFDDDEEDEANPRHAVSMSSSITSGSGREAPFYCPTNTARIYFHQLEKLIKVHYTSLVA